MGRRDDLKLGAVTGTLAASEVSVGSCASETATMSAGSIFLQDIPVGGGVAVAEPPVVLTQPSAGAVSTFSSTHLHHGRKLDAGSFGQIFCLSHGSIFSAINGSVIQGPATKGLSGAAVALDADKVSVGRAA